MATLEKIRSKSVLLVVIIAVALLAFILGDAITNGRNLFGNNTTVAKIGNEKIDIQEYQRKHQELAQQLEEARRQNPERFANYDTQVLSQEALDALINERLLNNAVEATGIQVSPQMLRFFMIENPQNMLPEMQSLLQSMQQSGIPFNSVEEAYNIIFTPQQYHLTQAQVEPFQRAWVAVEALYQKGIASWIYSQLLDGTYKANDLDIAAMKRDYVAAAKVKVAKKPYENLDKYKVSDADLQKAYEARKEAFRLPETSKEVSLIAVSVTPSAKDTEQATMLATTVVKELKSPEGVKKETRKNGLDVQNHEMRLSDVKDNVLKAFLETAPNDSVSIIQNNLRGFLIAKLNKRTTEVDSIEIGSIRVMGSKNLVNQVLEYANSGLPLDSINTKFGTDSVMYMAPQMQPLFTEMGYIGKSLTGTPEKFDSLLNTNGKYIVLDEAENQAVLATVSKKSAPTAVVEYTSVEYILQPSDATLSEAREKLQKYIDTNNTAQKFMANAQKAGYNAEDLMVNQSTPALPRMFGGYYPDSRSVVRWIMMDGKDGEVSKIYQSKDNTNPTLYAVAVVDTYEDYLPWDNKGVKEELTAQVRREKAGDDMIKKYSKGNLDATAQAMGVEPVDVEMLQSTKRDMTVTDNKVKGRILGSKPSKTMKVVKGNDGVYAYVIENVSNEKVDMPDEQFAGMFLQIYNGQNQPLILRGSKKLQNNIYKFEQGE